MQIDDALISRLEQLARLRWDAQERAKLKKDLGAILDMMDVLGELDTQEVDPLVYPGRDHIVLREDIPGPGLDRERSLQQAPDQSQGMFRVPRVIPPKGKS